MSSAVRAEVRRLLSLHSTAIFAALLIGCCFGPIIVMGLIYDPDYQGPINAGDLGKCVSIFHVLAIVFAGAYTATEVRSGSPAISLLTQKRRWCSLAAQYAVTSIFLTLTYVVGMGLALVTALFYPDGLNVSDRGWVYLGFYGVIVLLWCLMTISLAVITRSLATAVAVPIVWMLLIEQLMIQIPMLEKLTPWLPFTAGHSLLSRTLGDGNTDGITATTIFAVLIPVLILIGTAVVLHMNRDAP
ncbi:ABC transporter permease [Corynebacteriaceae bacterium 7-707]